MTKTNLQLTKNEQLLRIMLEQEGIAFSNAERWKIVSEHVQNHQHFLTENLEMAVSWDDAVFSWYETVYKPLTNALWTVNVRKTFPDLGPGDLYLAVSNHWFYLKENDPDVSPETAIGSFVQNYGTGMAKWFSRFLFA